jgi:hypothetical protein
MDDRHIDRPTSGASPATLGAEPRESHHRTLCPTEDLASHELMGPRLGIVNPVLWEIGQIAFFAGFRTCAL